MTPRTSRISPHAQSLHTILDHLAALTNCRISSGRLRIPCPANGGTNPNLALWGNVAAHCQPPPLLQLTSSKLPKPPATTAALVSPQGRVIGGGDAE